MAHIIIIIAVIFAIARLSFNQSIIYLLITHQAMMQFQFEHKTRRAGQPGTRCTYGCPYKTYNIFSCLGTCDRLLTSTRLDGHAHLHIIVCVLTIT